MSLPFSPPPKFQRFEKVSCVRELERLTFVSTKEEERGGVVVRVWGLMSSEENPIRNHLGFWQLVGLLRDFRVL